jgi:hypothetical protein
VVANIFSTVVEYLYHHPDVEGFGPPAVTGTERENGDFLFLFLWIGSDLIRRKNSVSDFFTKNTFDLSEN